MGGRLLLQGGEEDEPLIRREGWGDVVSTNAKDECSFFFFFYWIIQIILSGFPTGYFLC